MFQTHPYADIFPMMSDEAFRALVEDIRENGLREPIITHDSQILDGRNRYRACLEVGIEPITRSWDQRGDLLAFVVSKNLHRRHLSESQRAMVAAKIATLRHGGDRRSDDFKSPIGLLKQPDAAKMMNVGVTSVKRAALVRDNGALELQAAVERGEVSLYQAEEIAHQPKEEQRMIAAKGPKAVAEAAKEIREQKKIVAEGSKAMSEAANAARKPKPTRMAQGIRETYDRLREIMDLMETMPPPTGTAQIARSKDRGRISDQLPAILQWWNEFDKAFNRRSDDANAA